MTPWAPKWRACWEEPHCRSMVVAGTDSGKPAASTALRAMLRDCSPTCMTQPMITSSTRAGSRSLRSTRAFRVSERQVGGVPVAELPVPLAPRGADCIDDDGVGHDGSPSRSGGASSCRSCSARGGHRNGRSGRGRNLTARSRKCHALIVPARAAMSNLVHRDRRVPIGPEATVGGMAGRIKDMDRWLGDGGMELIGTVGGSFEDYGVDGEDLGWVTGSLVPTPAACNPHGVVQAGVHGLVLDAAMNFAINSALAGRDRTRATLEMKIETMRPAQMGETYRLRGRRGPHGPPGGLRRGLGDRRSRPNDQPVHRHLPALSRRLTGEGPLRPHPAGWTRARPALPRPPCGLI